jgi:pyruvate dehydrogenase E2 component (dihydrolipoamide acetyltransferase)
MAFDFYMPDIGEGVVEGEIVAWKVKVGDTVALDQPLVEVMTDKATVELPSPRAGKIVRIHFQDGQIAPVGKVLVEIDDGNSGAKAAPPPAAGHHGVAATSRQSGAHPAIVAQTGTNGAIHVIDATAQRARVLATPATRRLARQMGVEIGRVPATGRNGRVTTEDVKRFQSTGAVTARETVPHASAPASIGQPGREERVPLRGMRRKIAESMARSVHTAAHFTYVEEIDMTELVSVRERAKARAAERGVKLNYLPFIVKAVVSGLKKWPQLNASLDEATQEIVRKRYYHIGIAAQGPHGLAVSVVRDADHRSIFDLSKEIDRLGEAVRTGAATRDELTGSTFTISSLGKLGGVLATPIINFPEVAILGVHKIEERPAVRGGQIVARHLMNLSISVDHRLADGWDGAMFLQDVKSLLEDPTTMFMEMV